MRAGSPPTCPNSLELFTLFSLPFLHFYNFVGTQGRAGQREESGAAAASAGLGRWLQAKVGTGSFCSFVSSSQNSREGLPGVLPPSLGCLRRKKGESVHPSFQDGFVAGHKLTHGHPVSTLVWSGRWGHGAASQPSASVRVHEGRAERSWGQGAPATAVVAHSWLMAEVEFWQEQKPQAWSLFPFPCAPEAPAEGLSLSGVLLLDPLLGQEHKLPILPQAQLLWLRSEEVKIWGASVHS